MSKSVKSTVVIPAFNNAALTKQCLDAVLRLGGCEVVVVDDASMDDTAKMLAGFGDRIKVITHKTNQGFARTCNDGAKAARTEFVVFLNNDTIPQPGWLRALENHAKKNPKAAVVGSKLVYPNNTIQHAGVVICQDRYPRHIYTGFPADHPAVRKSRRFQLVTAASMLVRRKVFTATRGFDTKFKNGFEDVDFCLRLGGRGHEIHYCAASVVKHFESVAPGRVRHDKDNVALYRKRWLPKVEPDDMKYFIADDLLALTYEGSFPLHLKVSPLLATLDDARVRDAEQTLADRARQVADLTRENTKLRAELGSRSTASPALEYDNLRERIREMVNRAVPAGSKVLVISKGDGTLLQLEGHDARHFPQSATGSYAGHYPADSTEAIAALEKLRKQGAQYLVFPETAFWWLDFYHEFRQHLAGCYRQLTRRDSPCVIFDLRVATPNGACLLNSLPKSGSHLLTKVVKLIPGMRDTGVAFMPTNAKFAPAATDIRDSVLIGVGSPIRVSRDEIERGLKQVVERSFASGHVPFTREMADLLAAHQIKTVLILRDPRDVVVSHAQYIHESPDSRLHRYYLHLSPAERLMTSLIGLHDKVNSFRFHNLQERLEAMLPWMTQPNNYTTTFERLVGPQGGGTRPAQLQEIRNLCGHLGVACSEAQIELIADQSFGGTATFRNGTIGAWRQHFGAEHRRVCKDMIGQCLIDLGYEKDLNW